jgi:hypothetical protein
VGGCNFLAAGGPDVDRQQRSACLDVCSIIAIAIDPHEAEFWEGSGKIVSTVKFAYALATGTRPDLGEQRKVGL